MKQYDAIAQYYDLVMKSGYYNHTQAAHSLNNIIKTRKKVLEIGLGTGLLAEKLLDINPNYDLTGLEYSPAMLERSKARLANRARVLEGNVLSLDLEESFDIVYSHAGPLGFDLIDNDYHMYSFITNLEGTIKLLRNLADYLVNRGLLVLSIQSEETDADQQRDIGNSIVYSQKSYISSLDDKEMYFWEKDYIFKKREELLASERHKFLMLHGQMLESTMKIGGFQLKEVASENAYLVYQKMI
ncbi:MAG: methyltransferase domain-containing protein [Cyanobacteria bacterium P01_F01_bin.150]